MCFFGAACVILLALLIVIALMVWRWRVHQDPLPPRARTVFNNTFRRRKNADNELYGVHSQPTSNGATRHNVIKSLFITRSGLLPAIGYCFHARHAQVLWVCPSPKMVQFTLGKDQHVLQRTLDYCITVLILKGQRSKFKDAKMSSSFLVVILQQIVLFTGRAKKTSH